MNTVRYVDGTIIIRKGKTDYPLKIGDSLLLPLQQEGKLFEVGYLAPALYNRHNLKWLVQEAFLVFLDDDAHDDSYGEMEKWELRTIGHVLKRCPAGAKPVFAMHYPVTAGYTGRVVFQGQTLSYCDWDLRGVMAYLDKRIINLHTGDERPIPQESFLT